MPKGILKLPPDSEPKEMYGSSRAFLIAFFLFMATCAIGLIAFAIWRLCEMVGG